MDLVKNRIDAGRASPGAGPRKALSRGRLPALLAAFFLTMWCPGGYPAAAEPAPSPQGKLVIPGTGDSQRLLRLLAHRYEELHPGTKIVIPKSVGSGGGIRAVGEGEAEIGRIARTLKKSEERYGLTYHSCAYSPVIFAVHPSVENIAGLSTAEIIGIYSGKITDWSEVGGPSKKIYPVGREPGDSSRAVIEKNLKGFGGIESRREKVYYTTLAAVSAIEEHEYTIGYGPLSALYHTGLRILDVDGVEPNEANVLSGRYPLFVPFGVVTREPLSPLARSFTDFLGGGEARKIMSENGCYLDEDKNVPPGGELP
jgi:phosphate transport system substrate-binding protein